MIKLLKRIQWFRDWKNDEIKDFFISLIFVLLFGVFWYFMIWIAYGA